MQHLQNNMTTDKEKSYFLKNTDFTKEVVLDTLDSGKSIKITQVPGLDNLPNIIMHMELSIRNQMSDEGRAVVLIAVDEIYSNICQYSHATWVECACKINKDIVTIQFKDNGIPFNPLEKEDPDVNADLESRAPGGLGIYLVKKQMDKIQYQYQEGENQLVLVKNISE